MRICPDTNVAKGSRPLTYYLHTTIEPSSSQFLEVHTFPVLLYSQRPGLLDDLCFQFETIVIDSDKENMPDFSVEAGSYVSQIQVIEIQKHTDSDSPERIRVGRDDNNDIILCSGAISKRQAYFLKTEDEQSYAILDANSTNGTKVNGEELSPFQKHLLINLDQIEFGNTIRAVYLTPRGFYEFLQDIIRFGIT